MSGWNSKDGTVERNAPIQDPEHPNWWAVDCGCCNGISWGGCEPMECDTCRGGGYLMVHRPSGVIAEWPGGPLNGRAWSTLLAEIDAAVEAHR